MKTLIRLAVFLALAAAPSWAGVLDNAHAFPVPFEPAKGQRTIHFVGMSTSNTIDIYNLRGQKIRGITANDGTGEFAWDVANDSGQAVASGVYYCLIKSGSDSTIVKVIVAR